MRCQVSLRGERLAPLGGVLTQDFITGADGEEPSGLPLAQSRAFYSIILSTQRLLTPHPHRWGVAGAQLSRCRRFEIPGVAPRHSRRGRVRRRIYKHNAPLGRSRPVADRRISPRVCLLVTRQADFKRFESVFNTRARRSARSSVNICVSETKILS